MDISFFVFSGTGNTKLICSLFAEKLNGMGNRASIERIKKDTLITAEPECLVIAYPVHAFNAPAPVLSFIRRINKSEHRTAAYLIETSGEPLGLNDAAFLKPRKLLEKKGYDVKGFFSYVMPYNIIFPHSDGMASRMLSVAKRRIESDAATIANFGENTVRTGSFKRIVSAILRIEHPAMPWIGRHYKVTNDCIGCGLCEKNCPEHNIRISNGKPVFGNDCSGCMGCAFTCPKDAIRISILDGWRVNVKYDFNARPATDDEICHYLRSSYLRYFHKWENRTENHLEITRT